MPFDKSIVKGSISAHWTRWKEGKTWTLDEYCASPRIFVAFAKDNPGLFDEDCDEYYETKKFKQFLDDAGDDDDNVEHEVRMFKESVSVSCRRDADAPLEHYSGHVEFISISNGFAIIETNHPSSSISSQSAAQSAAQSEAHGVADAKMSFYSLIVCK